MPNRVKHHELLTAGRIGAYADLLGVPNTIFSSQDFAPLDDEHLIDVYVYTMEIGVESIEVAVTNGMSDQRMVSQDPAAACQRRELIQYFRKCSRDDALRLRDMAWLPLFDEFYLDCEHTVGWLSPESPWRNAFFLEPYVQTHRDFTFKVEGDPTSFLWHIPISDDERTYKREYGVDALIERMDAVKFPWVFDEANRPDLLS